jgi:hypothetical protein
LFDTVLLLSHPVLFVFLLLTFVVSDRDKTG